jgi:hypothetical protein
LLIIFYVTWTFFIEVGLQESENMNNQEIDIDIRTPVKTHDMFAGVNNMGE